MRSQHKSTKTKKDTQPVFGIDEMNLVEYPFATLNHKDNRTSIVVKRWLTGKDKKRTHVTWSVSTDVLVGRLPTSFGVDVWLALLKMWDEQGRPEQVYFTVYQILKLLSLPTTKQYYEAVKRELMCLKGVNITCEKSFWNNQNKNWVNTKGFSLIDEYEVMLCVEEDGYTENEKISYVKFGSRILQSIESGYAKQINLSFRRSLKRPITKELFRFLDKQFWKQKIFEIDIVTLAALLGMQEYKYASKILQVLQPAIDELIDRDYVASAEVFRVKRGKETYTRIRFEKAKAPTIWETLAQESTPEVTQSSDQAGADEVLDETYAPAQENPWTQIFADYGTTQELKDAWTNILKELKQSVGEATYYTFLANTVLLSTDDGQAVVGVANVAGKEWLENRMERNIRTTLNGYVDTKITTLKFVSIHDLVQPTVS